MLDLRHPLAVLATRLPWNQLVTKLAPIWGRKTREGMRCGTPEGDLWGKDGGVAAGVGGSVAGRPRLPLRLTCSLLYLTHAFNLSDEELCERWSENVVWQYFGGMDYYEPRLPCDATQIGRFRQVLGETRLEQILKATINTAVSAKAIQPAEFERVIVDTTVQEKAIAHPADTRLLEIARHNIVMAAKRCGLRLRRTVAKEGKTLRRKAGGHLPP